MNAATRSIFYWSIYLLILGVTLIFLPNMLLKAFGMQPAEEVYIRVVGMLILILSYYCYSASKIEDFAFYRWTVPARASVIVVFTIFVLLKLAEPMLIFFGLIDLLGAIWTGLALKNGDK